MDGNASNRNQTSTFGRLINLPVSIGLTCAGIFFYVALSKNPPPTNRWIIPLFPLLFLGLGVPGIIVCIFEKYIITPEGIRHINWTGTTKEYIEWKDVTDFFFKRRESGGRQGLSPAYHYVLIARTGQMKLDSMISNWRSMQPLILEYLPQETAINLGSEKGWTLKQ